MHHLEVKSEDVIEYATLLALRSSDADDVRGLFLEFLVHLVQMDSPSKSKALFNNGQLVVRYKHPRIERILKVLLHQRSLDFNACLVCIDEWYFLGSSVIKRRVLFYISK